jgi:hypothetical protein
VTKRVAEVGVGVEEEEEVVVGMVAVAVMEVVAGMVVVVVVVMEVVAVEAEVVMVVMMVVILEVEVGTVGTMTTVMATVHAATMIGVTLRVIMIVAVAVVMTIGRGVGEATRTEEGMGRTEGGEDMVEGRRSMVAVVVATMGATGVEVEVDMGGMQVMGVVVTVTVRPLLGEDLVLLLLDPTTLLRRPQVTANNGMGSRPRLTTPTEGTRNPVAVALMIRPLQRTPIMVREVSKRMHNLDSSLHKHSRQHKVTRGTQLADKGELLVHRAMKGKAGMLEVMELGHMVHNGGQVQVQVQVRICDRRGSITPMVGDDRL